MEICNSKGFGGNNATAVILSPSETEKILKERHDENTLQDYNNKLKKAIKKSNEYFLQADNGEYTPIYKFGENMITEEEIYIDKKSITIKIKGFYSQIIPTFSE